MSTTRTLPTNLDGSPLRDESEMRQARALARAAGDLDEARRLVRSAVNVLSQAGMHQHAEDCVAPIEAIEGVQRKWVSQ